MVCRFCRHEGAVELNHYLGYEGSKRQCQRTNGLCVPTACDPLALDDVLKLLGTQLVSFDSLKKMHDMTGIWTSEIIVAGTSLF